MLIPTVLSNLLSACAPSVGTVTMTALVAYESGARPYAIGDNTARTSYLPGSISEAERLAQRLIDAGHNIDVGYAQLNVANFAVYGLSLHDALVPCTNVGVAARILGRSYRGAVRLYGPGQIALQHALSAYNTGRYWDGLGYAQGVYATAASLRWQDPRPAVASARRALAGHRGSTGFSR